MSRNSLNMNLRRWGSNLINSYRFWQEIYQDFRSNQQTTLCQKLWAYRRGFRSAKIIMYGLNEQNYRQYMSDLDFHRLGSVNGRHRRWIDDKLTMKYVLHAFNDHLPGYYYMLDQGQNLKIHRLPDCPGEYGTDIEAIMALLESKGNLAVKLLAGSQGVGFYKLSCQEGRFFVNEEPVDRKYVESLLLGLRDYIITEFLTGHPTLSSICAYRANSVRVMTIKQPGTPPLIVGALMRFGCAQSGSVDNISAGGAVSLVDIDTGRFDDGRQLVGDEWKECSSHPDTGQPLEGELPFWEDIKSTVTAICNYLPLLTWLGFDIIILEQGFKIIEINSQAGIALHNYYHPLYKERDCERLFKQAIARSQGRTRFDSGGGRV